jgi:hypothetical protein
MKKLKYLEIISIAGGLPVELPMTNRPYLETAVAVGTFDKAYTGY